MSVGATYTQLVLFDGMNITDPEWLSKIKNLSEIPNSCNFWIFCDEINGFIENSLKFVTNSKVRLFKSSDPVTQMFDTLHDKCFNYSFILVVCDKNAPYSQNLNKIMKKHKHVCATPMDPCNINIKDIIHKIHYRKVKTQEFNHLQSAPADDLQQHSENKYDLQITEDKNQSDHLKKMSNNKNNRLGDQYKNNLYCLKCGKSFHTKDAQDKHIKAGHPDTTSDNDDDI